jgi:hypothetical protein
LSTSGNLPLVTLIFFCSFYFSHQACRELTTDFGQHLPNPLRTALDCCDANNYILFMQEKAHKFTPSDGASDFKIVFCGHLNRE